MAGTRSAFKSKDFDGTARQISAFVDNQDSLDKFSQTYTKRSAENLTGSATGVADGATVTLVTKTAPTLPASYRVCGYHVIGTGDARISVTFDNVEKYFGAIHQTEPDLFRVLPNPHEIAAGVVVAIKVTNTSGAAADYSAVLMGE